MSHCRRTPHEDAGDTAVLAGAQSPPDGDQFPGVDPVGLDYWILAWTDFPAGIIAE